MSGVLEFAVRLADEAAALLRGYFEAPALASRYKPDHTLLTEADLAADRLITAAIRDAFPDDHILSEEEDNTYPVDGRPTWIVDPLDGTTNFSQGLHHWGVSIARCVGGWPEAAALSFPMINERYSAVAGQGAWLNGRELRIPPADSHPVKFFLCDSRLNTRYTTTIPYKPRILGSAAYDFCALAKGAGVVAFESIPKIWDLAACWLVLKEAGGVAEAFGGEVFPLVPGRDYRGHSLPLLGAVDAAVLAMAWDRIVVSSDLLT